MQTSMLPMIKVKLVLCLIKQYIIKVFWGLEVQLYASGTSVSDRGKWSLSRKEIPLPNQCKATWDLEPFWT